MDDATIKASIVIPAYNAADTIGRAVASALAQTESRIEVLVVDDASTDATAATAASLAARDPRVRLVRHSVNRGPAAARNCGLAHARGDWVAPLDADDEIAPNRIETLMTLGEAHAADMVADNLLLCPSESGVPIEPMIAPDALPAEKWLSPAEFVAGNVGSRYTPRVSYGFLKPLMRRAFLQAHGLRYEERNRFGEDFLFSLACLLHGARWRMTPAAMYRYSVQDGTLTDVQSAADLLRIRTLEDELLRGHPMVAADPALRTSLRRHRRKIEHFYYYRAFTDALKARRFTHASTVLLEKPSGFGHIITESLMQAPRVVLKALRGGFRQPPPATPLIAAAAGRNTAGEG